VDAERHLAPSNQESLAWNVTGLATLSPVQSLGNPAVACATSRMGRPTGSAAPARSRADECVAPGDDVDNPQVHDPDAVAS
jgi:hypothetical protein